jgi:hypothetical protein
VIDIPWVLTSQDRLMLRLGNANYGDAPPATRATAIALGMLATVADVDGTTATVAANVPTINLHTNVDRHRTQWVTMGQTLAAMAWLRDMDVLHETARVIGSTRVHLIDCRGLASRVDPVMDFCGPEPGYDVGVEGPTFRPDEREAA